MDRNRPVSFIRSVLATTRMLAPSTVTGTPIGTPRMFKKYYILGVASCLLIPAVVLLGGTIFRFINPELAAGHPNYERNYRLLELAKNLLLLTASLMSMVLWFLTCFFLLKSKEQSYRWLPLAVLGPFGFIALSML